MKVRGRPRGGEQNMCQAVSRKDCGEQHRLGSHMAATVLAFDSGYLRVHWGWVFATVRLCGRAMQLNLGLNPTLHCVASKDPQMQPVLQMVPALGRFPLGIAGLRRLPALEESSHQSCKSCG